MGMTCEEALQVKASGDSTGKKTTKDSIQYVAGSNTIGKNIEDIISDAAAKINNLDCPDIVYSWLKDTAPFSYVVSFMGAGIELLKKLNGCLNAESLKDLVQSSTVADSICGVLSTMYASISEVLEIASKVAFVIFDAIDSARLRLEAAIKNLSSAVMTCIMNVYDMIELFLCNVIKLSLITDWSSLQELMDACPCICKFIAWITGCDTDDNGNDISTNSASVISCIREKLWFLDAMQIGIGLSNILNNYVKKYLTFLFDIVNVCIDTLFNMLIAPFRYLIKKYVKFLRKRWDLTFLIDPMKTCGLDCLLTYNTEKDDNGGTIYTMSIIDMINTFYGWIPCIEYPCKMFAEKLKTKLKQYNEDFRLTSDFWSKEFECDIYATCIRTDALSDMSSDDYLKEMWDKWSSLYDNLKSKKMEAKHCADDAASSSFSEVGDSTSEVKAIRVSYGATTETASNPVADAAQFATTQNAESRPSNGIDPLTSNEDSRILSIGTSIHDASGDGDGYFIALWEQFLRFIGKYQMTDSSFGKVCDMASSVGAIPGRFSGSSLTQFDQYMPNRPSFDFPDGFRRVNYFYTSSYDRESADRIANGTFRDRKDGETLEQYYARMYLEMA